MLSASGLIAGEGLMGLVIATFQFFEVPLPRIFDQPTYLAGVAVMIVIALILIIGPMRKAGSPEEPAQPSAMM